MMIADNKNRIPIGISKKKLFICNKKKKDMNKALDFNTITALIKQNVHEVEDTAQVWLYGSRARGEAHEESDWDVIVLSSKDNLSF